MKFSQHWPRFLLLFFCFAQTGFAAPQNIRVALTAPQGPWGLWCEKPLTITDVRQPGRALAVEAEEKIIITSGAISKQPVPGKVGEFYSGPLTIRTASGEYPGWQIALAQKTKPGGEFIRFAHGGAHPKWGRPYRGTLEIGARAVNIVALEDYLKGVVPWEMGAAAPLEALKAQAICARSNLLAKMAGGRHKAEGCDVCDFDHCQGYPGAENEKPATTQAVEQTDGLVLTHNGRVADAVYGTNSGGITASMEDVWQGSPKAYLRGVRDFSPAMHTTMAAVVKTEMSEADWAKYCGSNLLAWAQPGDAQKQQLASRRATSRRVAQLFQPNDLPEFYRWSRFITPDELAKALAAQGKAKWQTVTEIKVLERAPSGHIKRLQISGHPLTPSPNHPVILTGDSQIRSLLSGKLGSTTALPSSTFVATPQKESDGSLAGWIIKGAGWGHGVGMCQRGAQNHALAGWDCRQILRFYYSGVEVQKLD